MVFLQTMEINYETPNKDSLDSLEFSEIKKRQPLGVIVGIYVILGPYSELRF